MTGIAIKGGIVGIKHAHGQHRRRCVKPRHGNESAFCGHKQAVGVATVEYQWAIVDILT